MKFREVEPPETSQIVVPYHERPTRGLRIPALSLFSVEFKHWRSAHDWAVKNGDKAVEGVAFRLKLEMQHASREAVKIYQFAEAGTAPEREGLISWYDRTTKYLAWSRLWREMTAGVLPSPEGEAAQEPAAFWEGWEPDSDSSLPQLIIEQADTDAQCGIQVIPGLFRRFFEADPPEDETIWLEGQDIFVQATSPGEPGMLLEAKYQVRGSAFPADEYVTARPHLKSDVWQSYVDL